MFELSTNVSNYAQLRSGKFSAYDALYLGDFSCPKYPGNFSTSITELEKGVILVKELGKKCYLRLYAVPGNQDLGWVRDLVSAAIDMPINGIEVHNLGLLITLREINNHIPLHFGVFGNLYTDETARVLKEYGVQRVYPNPELSLDEIFYIQENTPIEVLVPVHGKIPLVISETCFIVEHAGHSEKDCGFACEKSHWLSRKEGDWLLKDTGRMTLSGKDLCMLEHLDYLKKKNMNCFYIQSHGEDNEYIDTIGDIYRNALLSIEKETEPAYNILIGILSGFSHKGMCNGYYFGRAGQQYVGRG
jgi:putative protease